MSTTTQVWVRIGDADSYADYDSLADAIDALKAAGVLYAGCKVGRGQSGIITDEYDGNNYISLYHGDSIAGLARWLDDDEFASVQAACGIIQVA